MVNLKRYSVVENSITNLVQVCETKEGEWVKFKDVVAQNSTSNNTESRAIALLGKIMYWHYHRGFMGSKVEELFNEARELGAKADIS
jgi:hypothetical protein